MGTVRLRIKFIVEFMVVALALLLAPGRKVLAQEITWGNGTSTVVRVEYSQALSVIEGLEDGSTIKINGAVNINGAYSSGQSGDDRPLIINKSINFVGTGNNPTLTIYPGGIILGANTTFKDLTLSLSNSSGRNAIIANGYKLTLDGVGYDEGAQGINLFCGSIIGMTNYSGITVPPPGSHGIISIINGKKLGKAELGTDSDTTANIYAGNLVESPAGTYTFSGDATVDIKGMRSSQYLGSLYATGAQERPGLGINLGGAKLQPPIPKDEYEVSGQVTFRLNSTAVRVVDGYSNNTGYASVIYNDGNGYYNGNIILTRIGSLKVESGNLCPADKSSVSMGLAALGVSGGAKLDISKLEKSIDVQDFDGGGELTMAPDQVISIYGNISGSTALNLSSKQDDFFYIVRKTEGGTYTEDAFSGNLGGKALSYDSSTKGWFFKSGSSGGEVPLPSLQP